jgi:hypothetical protein
VCTDSVDTVIPAAGLPVSGPLRVRDRLRAAPDGPVRVLHRGRHAVYVEVGGGCVGVVARGAALVPCALRAGVESFTPQASGGAYLRRGILHLDGRPLVVGRVVDVHVPRLVPRILRTASSATAVVIPPAAVAGFVADTGLTGSQSSDALVRRLPLLIGRGEGLTPLGDDLVCGWLAAHRSAGVATPEVDRAVRDLAPATTSLSAALLDCAVHGEVLPQFSSYLSALGTPAEPSATAALLAVGHTSGAGLLHGARLALADLALADLAVTDLAVTDLAHPIGAVA